MRLFSQDDNHERNYKPVNDVFFTHFELGYLTSYNILILAFQLQFGTYEAESEHFRWEKEKRHYSEWFSR